MVMKVGNINPIMFRSTTTVTKPEKEQQEYKQIKELGHVTPDYAVNTPQRYTKLGISEFPNGLKIHSYKLANGHKITIIPMENSPATVKNYVNVGSMNETDDIKGISHFLEHMAFNGTLGSTGYEKLEQGDSFKKIENLGGWTNASTNYAITDYVNSTPLLENKDLEEQIKVIASMTEDLALTDEMIEKEKGPVCSEINMILDNPQTQLMDQTVRSLFNIRSSSDELVGGSVDHIKNLDRRKVKSYYDTYYTPDNMNLVITGDVNPDEAIKTVAKHFKSTKRRNGLFYEERLNPIKSTIRKDFINNKATSAGILFGFAGPSRNDTRGKVLFEIAQEYLESSEAGIVKDLKPFNTYPELGADNISTNMNNPTLIYYGLNCAEENSEQALKVMFNKLSEIDAPSEKTLNNIKERMLQRYKNQLEYSGNVNEFVGQAVLENDMDYLTEYENIINSVTADEVETFIKTYMNVNKAAITVVHPQTTPEEIKKNYLFANNVSFKGGSRKPLNTEKVTEAVLPNNYRVAFQESKNDNFYIRILLNTDIMKEKFNPAAIEVLSLIYDMGNKDFNEDEFLRYQEDNNISIGASLGSSTMNIKGYSSTKNIEKTINGLADLIKNPRIQEKEFNEAISRIQDSISRSKDTSNSLYVDHQANINPLYTSKKDVIDGLKTVTIEEVQELHNYIINNSSASIVVNVPEKNPEIKDTIIKELVKLPQVKEFKYETHKVHQNNTKPIVITKDRNVSQADIMQTFKYERNETAKERACENILNTILTSSQSIGLFNTLREKEHLAYSVHSNIERVGNSGELSCSILTTTDNKEIGEISYDNVQKSINGFNRQINALLNGDYTDEDLESAKRGLKASLLKKEGTPAKLNAITKGIYTPYGIEFQNKVYEEIDSITREDIQELAEKIFKNPPIYTIVASQDTLNANKEYLTSLEQA